MRVVSVTGAGEGSWPPATITKALANGSGYAFTERGTNELRGLSGPLALRRRRRLSSEARLISSSTLRTGDTSALGARMDHLGQQNQRVGL
jgi:hypothetical protein